MAPSALAPVSAPPTSWRAPLTQTGEPSLPVPRAALEQVLSAVDLRSSRARRARLGSPGIAPLPPGVIALAYVIDGDVAVRSAGRRDAEGPVSAIGSTAGVCTASAPFPDRMPAGGAVLSLGRGTTAVAAEEGAELAIVEMELADTLPSLCSLLPDVLVVADLRDAEPSAAALAATMGSPAGALRSGDPVICRLMATTVLLSIVRAWAERGCAPAGWPHAAGDPYLDRVVEAIHEQPGREWTVALLAATGAMSRSVFAERFRAAFGRSPASYVTEVRMKTAKQLLRDGSPVSLVSRELGYGSDEGFSRAFRRHTGVAPSAWRASQPH